jgi:hypothetical protein
MKLLFISNFWFLQLHLQVYHRSFHYLAMYLRLHHIFSQVMVLLSQLLVLFHNQLETLQIDFVHIVLFLLIYFEATVLSYHVWAICMIWIKISHSVIQGSQELLSRRHLLIKGVQHHFLRFSVANPTHCDYTALLLVFLVASQVSSLNGTGYWRVKALFVMNDRISAFFKMVGLTFLAIPDHRVFVALSCISKWKQFDWVFVVEVMIPMFFVWRWNWLVEEISVPRVFVLVCDISLSIPRWS